MPLHLKSDFHPD